MSPDRSQLRRGPDRIPRSKAATGNSAQSAQPDSSEGVDFSDVIMPAAAPSPGSCSNFAREALKQLEPALELARSQKITMLSCRLSLIVGAVRHVAEGITDRIRFEVTESIFAFHKERDEMSEEWNIYSESPEVVRMRKILTSLEELYPVLDKIMETMVDCRDNR